MQFRRTTAPGFVDAQARDSEDAGRRQSLKVLWLSRKSSGSTSRRMPPRLQRSPRRKKLSPSGVDHESRSIRQNEKVRNERRNKKDRILYTFCCKAKALMYTAAASLA